MGRGRCWLEGCRPGSAASRSPQGASTLGAPPPAALEGPHSQTPPPTDKPPLFRGVGGGWGRDVRRVGKRAAAVVSRRHHSRRPSTTLPALPHLPSTSLKSRVESLGSAGPRDATVSLMGGPLFGISDRPARPWVGMRALLGTVAG